MPKHKKFKKGFFSIKIVSGVHVGVTNTYSFKNIKLLENKLVKVYMYIIDVL